ncbi:Branched-chain amino acid transport ATP-binding protein LivF [Euzebya pacifica]|uniref:Branched-chain amino acid transport ATP-binding protein LivF n=1 Tax=Euzebya pacifica TaxID=1608957 RepID=A0A346XWW2_9ACTN|nr:ABC transporter ATP-binding protein [Euzebya pacifica]AXV06709.1 Branched-chain amino acid transport ATP-binding protein LivF [Euzebya pacifica]
MTAIEQSPQTKTPILKLEQVEVVYNKLATAITGVSVEVAAGGITAVLGTNGAGKTTTLKAVSGFLSSDNADITDGHILLDGDDITGMAPHQVARGGIALVPERDKVFDTLTVLDNLKASARVADGVEDAFDAFPRLRAVEQNLAGYLSGGEKQMLAMAMALSTGPSLLLVDELSLGLAPLIVTSLLQDLRRVQRARGISVLLVEQNALAALDVADYGYVIEDGRIVFDGTPEQLLEHGDIKEFYLGTNDAEAARRSYRDVRQYRRKRRWWG